MEHETGSGDARTGTEVDVEAQFMEFQNGDEEHFVSKSFRAKMEHLDFLKLDPSGRMRMQFMFEGHGKVKLVLSPEMVQVIREAK